MGVAGGELLLGLRACKDDNTTPSTAEERSGAAVSASAARLVALCPGWVGKGKGDDGEELPTQTHGNLVLELGWTILPAVILAFVAFGADMAFGAFY